MRMTRPLTILALLAILPAPVLGESNTAVESAYTTFDSDTCRRTPEEDLWFVALPRLWRHPGEARRRRPLIPRA